MNKSFLLLIMLAVNGVSEGAEEGVPPEAPPPENRHALHAVSGERLRVIMQEMYSSVHENDSAGAPQGRISEEQMADLVEAVEELLFHAEMLSSGMPGSNLDETDLAAFRALAGQLYTEALNIQQLAKYYDYHLIEPAYDRLDRTCLACHRLFRKK